MSKPTLPSGQSITWNSRDLQHVYANIMQFSLSNFDISIIFGQIGEATESEAKADAKVRVILTPEQALNLKKLLDFAVTTYVETNGPLRTVGSIDIDEVRTQVERMKSSGQEN